MNRYCLVENGSNLVTNIVIWDGVSKYTPPGAVQMIPASNDVEIGWTFDPSTQTFTAPLIEE